MSEARCWRRAALLGVSSCCVSELPRYRSSSGRDRNCSGSMLPLTDFQTCCSCAADCSRDRPQAAPDLDVSDKQIKRHLCVAGVT